MRMMGWVRVVRMVRVRVVMVVGMRVRRQATTRVRGEDKDECGEGANKVESRVRVHSV